MLPPGLNTKSQSWLGKERAERTRHKLRPREREKKQQQQSSKVSDTDSHRQTLAVDPES